MGRVVDLDDLADGAEVAKILGLSDARSVSTYRKRYSDFPEPVLVSEGGRCRYWLRGEIEDWRKRRPDQGRP